MEILSDWEHLQSVCSWATVNGNFAGSWNSSISKNRSKPALILIHSQQIFVTLNYFHNCPQREQVKIIKNEFLKESSKKLQNVRLAFLVYFFLRTKLN